MLNSVLESKKTVMEVKSLKQLCWKKIPLLLMQALNSMCGIKWFKYRGKQHC